MASERQKKLRQTCDKVSYFVAKIEAQNTIEIGKLVLLAEARLGELFNLMPKAKENQYTKNAVSPREEKALDEPEVEKSRPKLVVAADLGFKIFNFATVKVKNANESKMTPPPTLTAWRGARRPA